MKHSELIDLRIERYKRGIQYFENNIEYNYVEYDENDKVIYKLWDDFDWIESKFDKGNEVYHYKCWVNDKDIKLMNIICK